MSYLKCSGTHIISLITVRIPAAQIPGVPSFATDSLSNGFALTATYTSLHRVNSSATMLW